MKKKKSNQGLLIGLVCFLAVVLLVLLGVAAVMSRQETAAPTEPTSTGSQPTAEPITEPTTEPATEPTTEPTTVPTTEPQPQSFTLTFAGDCTFGNSLTRTGKDSFIGLVGDNYDHPFADVKQFFEGDDATFVNLEVPLTDGGTPHPTKRFVFRGKPEYTNILTRGSVEFANIANNHTLDYGEEGCNDTMANLDAAGIAYAQTQSTVIFTTESGLTIGVYAENYPEDAQYVVQGIRELKEQGAQLIIACMHWGTEYHYKPSENQQELAHAAIDAGAHIVYGHHPHVLQPIEEYNGGIIYYSLGNFSFGGNASPPDKDTAILQQQVILGPDGNVSLGELTIIPCHVTGILSYGNDYQPTPMDPDSNAYARTLRKLDGTYEKSVLVVSYRDDLFGTQTADPEETEPEETEPEETDPEETNPEETEPENTDPPATDPPATDPPATDPPATDPPATDPPVTDPPATDPPATDPPPAEDPPAE